MSKINKFLIGFGAWTVESYAFAYWAHVAPEGAYDDLGSSLEVISVLFMFACFIGIPILTALWMQKPIKQGEIR